MKWIRWAFIFLFVVVLIAIAGTALFGGRLVRHSVNRFGPGVMGVPVSVEDVRVALIQGAIRMEGLRVGNPEGFKTADLFRVGVIDVEIDLRSLASDTVIIRRLHVEAPEITYEQGLRQSNLGALVSGMGGAEAKGGAARPSADTRSPDAQAGSRRVVIEDLLIAEGKVNLSVTGAMGLSAPVALAPLRMQNVGGGDGAGGMAVRDAIRLVLETVLRSVSNAVGGVGGLAVDGVKAMGEGATRAGQAALGGLQAAGADATRGLELMGDGARQVGGAAVEGVKTVAGDAARRLGGWLGRGETNAAAEASP